MINKVIHLDYDEPDELPWLITIKDIVKGNPDYAASPMKFEKLVAEGYDEEYEQHVRLVLNAYYLLKAIIPLGVKKIRARYHCNPLPVILVTLELDNGTADITVNLYAPDGKVELTSTREIFNFEVFKHDVSIEFKTIKKGIFKPVPRNFYVIDMNHILYMFEDNPEITKNIELLYELAQEISREVLK